MINPRSGVSMLALHPPIQSMALNSVRRTSEKRLPRHFPYSGDIVAQVWQKWKPKIRQLGAWVGVLRSGASRGAFHRQLFSGHALPDVKSWIEKGGAVVR